MALLVKTFGQCRVDVSSDAKLTFQGLLAFGAVPAVTPPERRAEQRRRRVGSVRGLARGRVVWRVLPMDEAPPTADNGLTEAEANGSQWPAQHS